MRPIALAEISLTGVSVYSKAILSGLAQSHPDTRGPLLLPAAPVSSFIFGRHRVQLPTPLVEQTWAPSADLFHGLNQRIDWAEIGVRSRLSTICS